MRNTSYIVTGGFILALSYFLSTCITTEKWFYLIGLAFVAVFYYLVWLNRRFEVGIILYLLLIFFWQYGLRRGWEVVFGLFVGHGTLAIIGIMAVYYIQRTRTWFRLPVEREQGLGKVKWLVLLYSISLLLSWLGGDGTLRGFGAWIIYGLETCLLFAFVSKTLRDEQAIYTFLSLLLLLGAFISLSDNCWLFLGKPLIPFSLGYRYPELLQPIWTTRVGLRMLHTVSAFGNTSFGGAFMAGILPIALIFLVKERRLFLKSLYALICLSIIINIICYTDRGTWLGVLASILVITLFVRKRHLASVVVVVVVAVLLLTGIGLVSEAERSLSLRELIHAATASERWPLWKNILMSLQYFPLLWGTGFRNIELFTSVVHTHGTARYKTDLGSVGGEWFHPHNSYLDLLVQAGLPVFLLFMTLLVHVVWRAVKAIRQTETSLSIRYLLVATLGGLIGFCTEAMFNRTLFLGTLNSFFWMYLGTVYGISLYLEHSTVRISTEQRKSVYE